MSVRDADGYEITPEIVLRAYHARCFPMADERGGAIRWYRPEERAVITWDHYKIADSLRKRLKQRPYRITVDQDFPAVIAACAERVSTWISHDVEALYCELHREGHAHSLEAWDADGTLVGGLYGLCIGGVFCGESMFHRAPDAAKQCVVELVTILRRNGFALLDCQQQTPHMERFGSRVISDAEYTVLLDAASDVRLFRP